MTRCRYRDRPGGSMLKTIVSNSASMLIPLVVLVGAVAGMAVRARPADRGTFVTTLGRDTVTLESFTRTSNKIDGDIVVRVPGTVLLHYTIDVTSAGAPIHSLVDITPLGTTQVSARRVVLDFTNDSMTVDFFSSGHETKSRVAITRGISLQLMTGFGASYGLYTSPALYETYPSLERAAVGDTVRLTVVDVATGRKVNRVLVKRSPTTIDADYFGIGWTHLRFGAGGRIVGADASATTEQTRTSRTDFIDLHAVVEKYAAADRMGKGIGLASPEVIARGRIGSQLVTVTYGSPRRRGRRILGNVVPFDSVWRTGANGATVLHIESKAEIGGTTVPAGTYSLWTLPRRDGSVELIINAQHGQWGTDFDKSHDLFHIPMKVSAALIPQENFTITIVSGVTGALVMRWDDFEWSVPVSPP